MEGAALDNGGKAKAVLKINREEAATFENVRGRVATSITPVAVSWHMLELHVTVTRPRQPQVQVLTLHLLLVS